jgi:hypothetical protein
MVVSLAGLFALFTNWRLGLVLLFAVAMDFVAMIWTVLPGASIRQEVVLVFAATLPLGVLVGAGRRALTPVWLTGAVASGVLALFQVSTYICGLAEGTLAPAHAVQTLPADFTLVVTSGVGLLLPAVLLRRRLHAARGGVGGTPAK